MNEMENRGTAGEAIVGIILLFVIIVLLLYKFGGNNNSVNSAVSSDDASKQAFLNEINSSSTDNEIYNKYIKQIYELQSSTGNSIEVQNQVGEIASSYQSELEQKVALPPQTVYLKNVSDKFTKNNYANNFELIYQDFKKKDGTNEGNILTAQIGTDGTVLPLSEYDKESLLRIAVEYEIFSEKIQNLSTPKSTEKIATEIAVSALNISYILNKIVVENDKTIYPLWISKYVENMSVIIADRYAIQQKI